MNEKKDGILIAKNVFKTENKNARKQVFNKLYENYINSCENKI
jgi:hypothetical protein